MFLFTVFETTCVSVILLQFYVRYLVFGHLFCVFCSLSVETQCFVINFDWLCIFYIALVCVCIFLLETVWFWFKLIDYHVLYNVLASFLCCLYLFDWSSTLFASFWLMFICFEQFWHIARVFLHLLAWNTTFFNYFDWSSTFLHCFYICFIVFL